MIFIYEPITVFCLISALGAFEIGNEKITIFLLLFCNNFLRKIKYFSFNSL